MRSDTTGLCSAHAHMMEAFSHQWRDFLHHLKAKAYQNRKIAFVENGSWAPTAARQMKAIVEGLQRT